MALGRSRYGGDLLLRAGFRLALPEPTDPYPVLQASDLAELAPDWLLLSSEPWAFTLAEGRLLQRPVHRSCATPALRRVDGRLLTWFGADSLDGLLHFQSLRRELGGGLQQQ